MARGRMTGCFPCPILRLILFGHISARSRHVAVTPREASEVKDINIVPERCCVSSAKHEELMYARMIDEAAVIGDLPTQTRLLSYGSDTGIHATVQRGISWQRRQQGILFKSICGRANTQTKKHAEP